MRIWVGLTLLAATMGFTTQVATPVATVEPTTLRALAEGRDFAIGAAVSIPALQTDAK